MQRRWRQLQAQPGDLRPVSLAIAAGFTVEPLLPHLGCALADRGFYPRLTVAPFDRVIESLLDPQGPLRRAEPEATVVLPLLDSLCRRALRQLAQLDPKDVAEARTQAHAAVDRLGEALSSFAQATTGTVLCGTFPPPASSPLGILDAGHPASPTQLHRELNLALWQIARRHPRLRLVDVDAWVGEVGGARAWDRRMAYLAACPFSADFLGVAGERLARSIAALFLPAAKVIVADLDNTLWGGIVGEDGPGGLQLGGAGIGTAFVDFQEALLALRAQGTLLCIASKNNEADAFEVIDRHPEMRIRREHLAAHRISWQAKSDSLRELARELSLGLDSFVFVDDSATECDEVRRRLPEVKVLQLPPDPARYVDALAVLPAFDRMTLTDEDRQRADLYLRDQMRAAMLPRSDADDAEALRQHLRSLELRATVRRLGSLDVGRAAQLTQKTNQFNLTTIRRTEAEIEAMRRQPGWRLYVLQVADRFGDYGLTGLLFAEQRSETTWDIDTMLLSCRILGRELESALLQTVAADLAATGASRLTGRFIPTAKNAPASSFFSRHGFVEQADESWLKQPLPGSPFDIDHLAVRFVSEWERADDVRTAE